MVPLRVSGTMCWWDRGPRGPGSNGAGSLRKAGEEGAGGGFLKVVGKPIEAEPLRGGGGEGTGNRESRVLWEREIQTPCPPPNLGAVWPT